MLGNAVLRFFALDSSYEVHGSVRNIRSVASLQEKAPLAHFLPDIDVENLGNLSRLFAQVQPDVVINCIGIVKQLADTNDPLISIPINSLLPHRLARLCEQTKSRFIHMSTDCIFSGIKGTYTEVDTADASDLYGRSKYLGEVDYPNAITLRTSIIGVELDGARSLIGWFLAQEGSVKGYINAIFSGLPTVEIARVIRDHVIPHPELHGVYHVSAAPISKFDLLTLVAQIYGKTITICPDDQLKIDRSLDSSRLQRATNFKPKPWPYLIRMMRDFG